MTIPENKEPISELVPFTAIRVETVLSRFPVHKLATRGNVTIDINERDENGVTISSWKVGYSATYGQPGPLAYKLDTLIINRHIEEARPRVPKLLRLGSLSDICKELELADSGKNRSGIKKALLQNAFAGIVPLINYNLADGSENTLDSGFTRYSVIFTGKTLPNGQKANAVYIILNDIFLHVINGATTRPLDYDYLKGLPPASQRFYEILSYRMYGTLKHDRPRVKLVYSEFCAYAPQKRHLVKKQALFQMKQVCKRHIQSGYITEVTYQEVTDAHGQFDLIMLFKPGPKARAEFRAFEKRGGPNILEVEPFDPLATGFDLAKLEPPSEPSPLAQALDERGLSRSTISEILANVPATVITAQIEYFDWRMTQKDKKVSKSPAGFLARAILEDWKAPPGFVSQAEREHQAEAAELSRQQKATADSKKLQEEAAELQRRQEEDAWWSNLTPEQHAEHEAKALASASPELRETYVSMKRAGRGRGEGFLSIIRREYARKSLEPEPLAEPA